MSILIHADFNSIWYNVVYALFTIGHYWDCPYFLEIKTGWITITLFGLRVQLWESVQISAYRVQIHLPMIHHHFLHLMQWGFSKLVVLSYRFERLDLERKSSLKNSPGSVEKSDVVENTA